MIKSIALTVAALAAVAIAQADFNGLPGCGKVCIPNMLGQAVALGCPGPGDVSCLCRTANFNYGIRDCISQACPQSDQGAVRAYAAQVCAAGHSGSGVQTVGADGGPGVIVASGTNAQGQPVQTTLGPAGAPVASGAVITITSTNERGEAYTTVSTFNGGMVTATATAGGSGGLATMTDSAGSVFVTTTGAPGGGAGGIGGAVITTTDASGNTITTTLPAGSASSALANASGSVSSALGSMVSSASAAVDSASSALASASGSLSSVVATATTSPSGSASASGSAAAATTGAAAPRATAMAGLLGLAAFVVVL